MDVHSAVLVVALAAILGSLFVFVAIRKDLRKWWVFVGCGIFAGEFPATFYLVAAPDTVNLPLIEMYIAGAFCGLIGGMVLKALLGSAKPSAATL
jgi:hypothetical protein